MGRCLVIVGVLRSLLLVDLLLLLVDLRRCLLPCLHFERLVVVMLLHHLLICLVYRLVFYFRSNLRSSLLWCRILLLFVILFGLSLLCVVRTSILGCSFCDFRLGLVPTLPSLRGIPIYWGRELSILYRLLCNVFRLG